MQEGIEPTISTIPSGCTNEIVSGDQPSTVSGNHSQHTISFSSECGWIPVSRCTPYSPGCREQNPSFDSVLIHIIFTAIPPNSNTSQSHLWGIYEWGDIGFSYWRSLCTQLLLISLTGNFCGNPKAPSTPLAWRQGKQGNNILITLVWVACSYSLIPDTHLLPRHIGRLRWNPAIFTCVP